ncbi:hypothetical protein Poly51_58790 [Rubripirellula tenax]|uniref:Uncharacterized protein n=1 Tax=Rubripirellula tenax TaxID=2528015 RepID=A0A5C6E553_9BACT|nr:hypothetical protein Poly51_58790 [Rubripirellula tenax]
MPLVVAFTGIVQFFLDRRRYRIRIRAAENMHFESEFSPGFAIGRVADPILEWLGC